MASSWFGLWIIVLSTDLAADSTSPVSYTMQRSKVTFDKAVNNCLHGVLASLATEQDVSEVHKLVSNSVDLPSNFTIWVGLKKDKKVCINITQPLRGFKWIEDGNEKSQVQWVEEPKLTCTSVLCAALTGEFDGSTVTRWGLKPVSCKTNSWFICKHTNQTPKDKGTLNKSTTTKQESTAPGPMPTTPEPTKPATQNLEPLATQPVEIPTQPQPETDLKSTTGPELVKPQPGPSSVLTVGLDSCQHPVIPLSRSLSLDPSNSSRIQVECWSNYQLELHCGGHPAMWRLPDDSPANFTTICQLCEVGLQKDAYGNCVTINKCHGAPCRHTCLNTVDSLKCVCSDENGKPHKEDSEVCVDSVTAEDNGLLSGILIPVLVAVAVLVVLLVVVVVAVKCCLKRRSKKRAMKKAEKMAMKNKDSSDSFATANEKRAR
ncbi:hypothetical protein Q5P01_021066 [Channa striata]|uniref:C-type lectin domain-containing protein n=1 Tax=Channa striata TaxID=64152 RepID=A0AA88S2F8_CHASR|nr:hypothetical protein Q5P01_021066 [Channa striata]